MSSVKFGIALGAPNSHDSEQLALASKTDHLSAEPFDAFPLGKLMELQATARSHYQEALPRSTSKKHYEGALTPKAFPVAGSQSC